MSIQVKVAGDHGQLTTDFFLTPPARVWSDGIMDRINSIAEWMAERNINLGELIEATGLDRKVVQAIVHGRYTPSPEQRRRIAAALGTAPAQIAWGHTQNVEHIYGHGPQFGRSP